MSQPQEGDDDHIRGFILNKLYIGRYWAKPGKEPRRHTSVKNMPKGYPPKFRGDFKKNIEWLRRKGFVLCFPHSGDKEHHICAILDKSIIDEGLKICNGYRLAVGQLELNEQFKERVVEEDS